MADVQQNIDLRIDIGELASFADYLFDGLIIDWIVQSKIVDSLGRVRNAKRITVQAVNKLEGLNKTAQIISKDLQEKRTQLIEQTT